MANSLDGLLPAQTYVDERRNLTTSDKLRLTDDDAGTTMPGPGVIDTVMVRAESENFRVNIQTDKSTLVNDDWATLNEFSEDLQHVDAYADNSNNVLTVTGYPYKEFASVVVDPIGEVEFDRIRAEYIMGLPL